MLRTGTAVKNRLKDQVLDARQRQIPGQHSHIPVVRHEPVEAPYAWVVVADGHREGPPPRSAVHHSVQAQGVIVLGQHLLQPLRRVLECGCCCCRCAVLTTAAAVRAAVSAAVSAGGCMCMCIIIELQGMVEHVAHRVVAQIHHESEDLVGDGARLQVHLVRHHQGPQSAVGRQAKGVSDARRVQQHSIHEVVLHVQPVALSRVEIIRHTSRTTSSSSSSSGGWVTGITGHRLRHSN
mmetsp:Transcript_2260/g.3555  ORF Transcript_2260/g.3555 Transcript_2260/m.3555 type:complete len:237 (-) Transcript_2260:1314-2024(-)